MKNKDFKPERIPGRDRHWRVRGVVVALGKRQDDSEEQALKTYLEAHEMTEIPEFAPETEPSPTSALTGDDRRRIDRLEAALATFIGDEDEQP